MMTQPAQPARSVWDRALDDPTIMSVVHELPRPLYTDPSKWADLERWLLTATAADILADVEARRPAARAAARAAREEAARRIEAGASWAVVFWGRDCMEVWPTTDDRPVVSDEQWATQGVTEYGVPEFFGCRMESDPPRTLRVRGGPGISGSPASPSELLAALEQFVFRGHMQGRGAYGSVGFSAR
ncbi:MAG: hypothetical protein DYG90_04005 [Chloroflexi bacterium CFX6]|nr:hypothetical protein [Chloroflexi bacterium CFX6]